MRNEGIKDDDRVPFKSFLKKLDSVIADDLPRFELAKDRIPHWEDLIGWFARDCECGYRQANEWRHPDINAGQTGDLNQHKLMMQWLAAPTWDLVGNVRDLTLNLESGEADVSTRANNGWRATVGTLKDASLEFEMVWDTVDTDFTAIRDAFLNNTTLEFAVMDGLITGAGSSGSQGLRATFRIASFSRNESLEEAITVSVTAKPTHATNPPTWMTVA